MWYFLHHLLLLLHRKSDFFVLLLTFSYLLTLLTLQFNNMTVSYICNVFGIKVSRAKLFQWILQNKDHEWYNLIKNYEGGEKERNFFSYFENFVKYMICEENGEKNDIDIEDFDDIASDINIDIVSVLDDVNYINYFSHSFGGNEEFKLKIMEITHDVCEDKTINTSKLNNIVIGIVTDVIMLNTGLYNPVDPESKLPFTNKLKDCECLYKYSEQVDCLKNHPFVKFMGQDLQHYLVQNGCTCCS